MVRQAIVIGSGLGGLSVGVLLSQRGFRVTVLEQGATIGGCLQCFTRGGVRFETGMHFVGSLDPGQTLHSLLDKLEILPELHFSRLDTACYNTIRFGNEEYSFANGREAFIEELLQPFPHERRSLEQYMNLVEQLADVNSLDRMFDPTAEPMRVKYQVHSLGEVLDELVPNRRLADVLCGDLTLYAAQRDLTPFGLHAQLMDFYNRSAFRIVGGSDSISRSLTSVIQRYGGKVLSNVRVTKLTADTQRITAVSFGEGETLQLGESDVVVSAIHPQSLLPLIDGVPLIRRSYRSRLQGLRNTPSIFAVYFKFRKDTMPYVNHNTFGYRQDHPWNCEAYDDQWPKGYLYMHSCPREDAAHPYRNGYPVYAEGGVVFSYMNIEQCNKWLETRVGQRGADYQTFKKEHAERLIDLIESHHPGLRASIESYYTSTPLTYRDYCGTPDGSMYGIFRDVTQGPACHVGYRTRVPNLFLAGQNVNSHGILGVLVGSMVVAHAIAPES